MAEFIHLPDRSINVGCMTHADFDSDGNVTIYTNGTQAPLTYTGDEAKAIAQAIGRPEPTPDEPPAEEDKPADEAPAA